MINSEEKYKEYRKQKRFGIEKNILCYKHIIMRKDKKSSKAPFKIKILNLSYSGLKIRTERELNIGDILIFNLADNSRVQQFMMEVVWSKYDGDFVAGLKFINLTRDMILFLNNLIKNYVEKEIRLNRYK